MVDFLARAAGRGRRRRTLTGAVGGAVDKHREARKKLLAAPTLIEADLPMALVLSELKSKGAGIVCAIGAVERSVRSGSRGPAREGRLPAFPCLIDLNDSVQHAKLRACCIEIRTGGRFLATIQAIHARKQAVLDVVASCSSRRILRLVCFRFRCSRAMCRRVHRCFVSRRRMNCCPVTVRICATRWYMHIMARRLMCCIHSVFG